MPAPQFAICNSFIGFCIVARVRLPYSATIEVTQHPCDMRYAIPWRYAICDTQYGYSIHRTMIVAGATLTRSPSEMVFITQAVSRPTIQRNRTTEIRDCSIEVYPLIRLRCRCYDLLPQFISTIYFYRITSPFDI